MTTSPTMRQGDVGTKIRTTITNQAGAIVDVSATTSRTIRLEKPSGVTIDLAASFETDGTDGVLYYVTVAGDIDELGGWRAQGIVEWSGGAPHFSTSIVAFTVSATLQAPTP